METFPKLPTRFQENKGGDRDDIVFEFGNIGITQRGSRTLVRNPEIPKPSPPPEAKTVHAPPRTPSSQQPSNTKPSPPPPEDLPVPSFHNPPRTPTFQEPTKPYFQPAATAYEPDHPGNGNGYNHAGVPAGYGQPPPNPLQEGLELLQITITPEGSEMLRKSIKQANHFETIISKLFPHLCLLMADKYGQRVFEALVDQCKPDYLYAILELFKVEKFGFLKAAVCEPGSRSIQSFTKKLKNNPGLEYAFTDFLARFGEFDEPSVPFGHIVKGLMLHKIACHVVRMCFVFLGDEANEILYKCMAANFGDLAVDPIGCITINEAIDSVRSSMRLELLKLIITYALPLSLDTWGHFVVQHVLNLRNEQVSAHICAALEGRFAEIAVLKGGSRVVEKCLKSEYGRGKAILSEIFKDNKTLLTLASDRFGNYVVQNGLNVVRMKDPVFYGYLIQILKPHHQKVINAAEHSFENNFKPVLQCI